MEKNHIFSYEYFSIKLIKYYRNYDFKKECFIIQICQEDNLMFDLRVRIYYGIIIIKFRQNRCHFVRNQSKNIISIFLE